MNVKSGKYVIEEVKWLIIHPLLFFFIMRPEGPLITKIGRESVVPRNVTTCREENVVIFAQVKNTTDVITGLVAPVVRLFAEVKYFCSQGEGLADIALPQPTQLPEVFVPPAGIDPVSASAVGRPWAPALLSPDREEQLHVATPETALPVTSGQLHEGEGADLWGRLVLMDKSVLESQLRVPNAVHGWSTVRMSKGKRK